MGKYEDQNLTRSIKTCSKINITYFKMNEVITNIKQ